MNYDYSMSLKKIFFKTKVTYRIYLYYNLYIRHKGYQKRKQYSQWGEDLEIEKFFNNQKNGSYLDIGCYHPFLFSNTYLLFNKGWSGTNIDMNPTSIDLFNIARPEDTNICTAVSDETKEIKMYFDDPFSPANTIDEDFYNLSKKTFFKDNQKKTVNTLKFDEIIKLSNLDNKIDFINIDLEGSDFRILKQINFNKLQVKLMSVETHHVDGSRGKDCQQIIDLLKINNFNIYKRVGPTTLFNNQYCI